jgi:hypothetical protein
MSNVTEEGRFTIDGWDADGAATLVAVGPDARSALAAGLRATLRLVAPAARPSAESHAVPLHGTGADLASLFADLVEDLGTKLDDGDGGLSDVVLDGLLRRNEGGYRGWGYAFSGLAPARCDRAPAEVAHATVVEDEEEGVVLRATLRRR